MVNLTVLAFSQTGNKVIESANNVIDQLIATEDAYG